MAYWEEYFGQYETEVPIPEGASNAYSKGEKLHEIRSNNCHIVEQIIANVT